MQRTIHWGRVWAQEECTGLWACAKVRPRWYWALVRVKLFLGIVWRRYESDRIDWRTAWDVSECAVGLVGPMRVNTGWPQAAREMP